MHQGIALVCGWGVRDRVGHAIRADVPVVTHALSWHSAAHADPRVREAIRLHQRYQREVVERFDLCPWAEAARTADRSAFHVVLEPGYPPDRLAPLLARWSAERRIDIGFILWPPWAGDREDFERYAESLVKASRGVFLTASFFPGACRGTVQMLRQTPDPTIQLVRTSRLARLRAKEPSHYADIFEIPSSALLGHASCPKQRPSVFEHNAAVVEREGREAIQSILHDIRADRDKTYASLWASLDETS
jgi:hypothetical protein